MSFLEGITGSSSARDQANRNMESIDEQIDLLNKQRQELATAYDQKKGIVKDQYETQSTYLREGTAMGLGDIEHKYDTAASKTDLAYSGTVEYGRGRETEGLNKGYEYKQQTLYDKLGENLLDVNLDMANKFGQIDSQISGLKSQRKSEQARSEEKFLGLF